ncbi:putative mitochondrial protein [Acanthamoeba polyphaga mimivirus]|uniref:Mitochondrial protein n=1 Tax=Acanthamoeba polyphaga mimivirus Kroon TaxID=3069720 RepID=A0A0G2Y3U4_9VIRU|nr:putative mitochondrial protein [Acanthamoeba polyphaga mimivirus]AKI80480.1 putative mitochondrial protein [Acanthamoeba polyphaga mimivirus Kroon]
MDKRTEETSVIPESLKYAGPMSRLARAFSGFRMASYASDVGEATRGTFPNQFVHSMYAVTVSYIFVDLYFRYKDNKHLSNNKCDSKMTELQKYMGYHTLWHAQASLLFPTVTIHSVVSLTKKLTANINWLNPKVKKFAPVGLSLALIPVIIKPLDELADKIMDCSYCKLTCYQPHDKHHNENHNEHYNGHRTEFIDSESSHEN